MGIKRIFLRAWVVLALLTAAAAGWIGKPDPITDFPTTKEFARFLPNNIGYVVNCDAAAGMHQGSGSFPDGDVLQFCSPTGGTDKSITLGLNEAIETARRRMHLKSFLFIWLGVMGAVIAITFVADWVARGAGRGFLFDNSPPQGAKLASWLGATGLLGSLALGFLLDLPEWTLWIPILFVLADQILASQSIATRWVRYPSILVAFGSVMFGLNLLLSIVTRISLSGDPSDKFSKDVISLLPAVSWVGSFFAARAYAKWMARRAPRPWISVATTGDPDTKQEQSSMNPKNKDRKEGTYEATD